VQAKNRGPARSLVTEARGLLLDGGRVRPDGERLRWQTARSPSADLPFLCGDLVANVGEGGHTLAQRIAARGEGPYALVLHTDKPQSTGTLDLARTHGALIGLDLPPVGREARLDRSHTDPADSAVGG
jgi:hypothetical protein